MCKPQTFQEMATKAHDMEVMIANHHRTSFGFVKSRKDKAEFKRNVEFSKNCTKEVMSVFEAKLVWTIRKQRRQERPTPKELQKKEYPFPDLDFAGIHNDLLKKVSFNF